MTNMNWGFEIYLSGKNYKVAQTFGVLLDEKNERQVKIAEGQNIIRPCKLIISCCLIFVLFSYRPIVILNTWDLS